MKLISPKTRKMLWGRAGARCSFPGCQIQLIQLEANGISGAVIGEEAHIIAREVGGPRGVTPIERERLNLYENLILLCPSHHTVVDKQPEKYSVQMLHEMKVSHELWVDRKLGDKSRAGEFHYLPDPIYARFCSHRLIHLWKFEKAHIICDSYGDNPVEILPGVWKGSGVTFLRFGNGDVSISPEYVFGSSEAEFDVEYRCSRDALEITTYTYDPRVEGLTAFSTMLFEHDSPIERRVLFIRMPPDSSAMEPVIERLTSVDESADLPLIEKNIYIFRNIGLSTPHKALAITKILHSMWWHDGAAAETLSEVSAQFRLAIDAENVV